MAGPVFYVVAYMEKSGAVIVANKGRVFTAFEEARAAFDAFVMHTGCSSVTLWECPARPLFTRDNGDETPVCDRCGSQQTEYYGGQVHCFACGAVYHSTRKDAKAVPL